MSTIITPLLHTFSTALTTNALVHLLSKISFAATTFLLYHTLSSTDFSIWATMQSIIFLMVLWLDCGLRKSIPRYAPLFSNQRHQLLYPLLLLQAIILIIALPILIHFLSAITTNSLYIILATGIYLAEALNNIFRSLYHAYFYHRAFNQYAALCTIADTMITIILIFCVHPAYLVPALFLTKFTTTTLLTSIALTQWHTQPPPYGSTLLNSVSHNGTPSYDAPSSNGLSSYSRTRFIKYSLYMWGTTILTSISERNFLLPYIIGVTNIHTGNLFKVANDGALLFYRLIIKTIGSADTALLAHVHTYHERTPDAQLLMQQSVTIVSTKIARLALPLLVIILGIVPIGYFFYHDQYVFHAFLIMAIGYVVETILIPYERVLEVKENYKILSYIYMIYTILIASLFFIFYMTWIGLIYLLIGIHGVRLVIGLLMRYGVYHTYGL